MPKIRKFVVTEEREITVSTSDPYWAASIASLALSDDPNDRHNAQHHAHGDVLTATETTALVIRELP